MTDKSKQQAWYHYSPYVTIAHMSSATSPVALFEEGYPYPNVAADEAGRGLWVNVSQTEGFLPLSFQAPSTCRCRSKKDTDQTEVSGSFNAAT